MLKYLNQIFDNSKYVGCEISYYPFIDFKGNYGELKNLDDINLAVPTFHLISDNEYDEYTYLTKSMLVFENHKEYINTEQIGNILNKTGLFIINKTEHIDPNKFPIINQYNCITHVHETIYGNNYVRMHIVKQDGKTYLLFKFIYDNMIFEPRTVYDRICKNKIIAHLTEAVSLQKQK